MIMEQLTLMNQFDKSLKKELSYLEHVLDSIKNTRFLRTRVSFSDFSELKKESLDQLLGNALYEMAFLAFALARYNPRYRYKSLQDFKDMTQTKNILGMSESPTKSAIVAHLVDQRARLSILFKIDPRYFSSYHDIIERMNGYLELSLKTMTK